MAFCWIFQLGPPLHLIANSSALLLFSACNSCCAFYKILSLLHRRKIYTQRGWKFIFHTKYKSFFYLSFQHIWFISFYLPLNICFECIQNSGNLNRILSSDFWWLRSANHVKFIEEFVMCIGKQVLVRKFFTKGLNVSLPLQIWVEKTVHEMKTNWPK